MSKQSRMLWALSYGLACGPALATCALSESCYDIGGEVKSCESVVQDKQAFLRIALKEIEVTHRMCDAASEAHPSGEPPASNFAAIVKRDIAYYKVVSFYYLPATPGLSCKTLKRRRITATANPPCCDTFPERGACALRGAVIALTSKD